MGRDSGAARRNILVPEIHRCRTGGARLFDQPARGAIDGGRCRPSDAAGVCPRRRRRRIGRRRDHSDRAGHLGRRRILRPQGVHRRHLGRHAQSDDCGAGRARDRRRRVARRRLCILRLQGRDRLWRSDRLSAGARRRLSVRPRRARERRGRHMNGLARLKRTLALAGFALPVIVYPLIYPGSYPVGVGIIAGAMAAGTVGFVLLIGFAHQLAFGQAGFLMVGGYVSAILTARFHVDPFAALLVGAVLAMVIAYVIGWPIMKLRGFVLAMASLAMQLIFIVLAVESEYAGGALGTHGVPKFAIFGISFANDVAYYYVVWALALRCVAMGL